MGIWDGEVGRRVVVVIVVVVAIDRGGVMAVAVIVVVLNYPLLTNVCIDRMYYKYLKKIYLPTCFSLFFVRFITKNMNGPNLEHSEYLLASQDYLH